MKDVLLTIAFCLGTILLAAMIISVTIVQEGDFISLAIGFGTGVFWRGVLNDYLGAMVS